jgi:HlyD family secretion protein
MKAINKLKNKKYFLPALAVLIIVVSAVGYASWSRSKQTTVTTAASAMQTSRARSGNLTVSASGSGTLVASRETALSFSTSGVVATLNVLAGDHVEEGQILAELGNLDSLKTNVNAAELALTSARLDLENIEQNAPANLANAQLNLATAQKALIDSKSHLVKQGMVRCDQEMTDAYYEKYLVAQRELDDLGDGGGSKDYYLHYIVPAKNTVAQAYSTYIYCAGYTVYEIDATQANLSLAEAELKQAQATLDTLKKNDGIDPNELAIAQNTVANAELSLDKANETLAGAKLIAPFAGTILTVEGLAGDQVDTATFITMADMAHPQVQFSIDETDMDKAEAGKEAQIVFDALPNRTFSGTVLRIFPSLATVSGSQVIQGLIQLDLSKEEALPTLPTGLNASIEIISGNAQNAVLVPIQAVRDIGNGEFGVFVLNKKGQPRLVPVKVGLMDTLSAQILEGVALGDTVTTGITEVK